MFNIMKNILNIEIFAPLDVRDAKLEVTNALEQVVQISFIKQTINQLNIQQLSSGVYFIEVKTNKGSVRENL
jgi:hypothetical protein